MHIRTLVPKDLEDVYQLDKICFAPGIAFPRHVFEYCLSSNDCLNLGVYEADQLYGFIITQARTDDTASILTLEVEQQQRGQGLAEHLIQETEKQLLNSGFKWVNLQVAEDNDPAKNLYRKWGYKEGMRLGDYYGPGMDAIHMEKRL